MPQLFTALGRRFRTCCFRYVLQQLPQPNRCSVAIQGPVFHHCAGCNHRRRSDRAGGLRHVRRDPVYFSTDWRNRLHQGTVLSVGCTRQPGARQSFNGTGSLTVLHKSRLLSIGVLLATLSACASSTVTLPTAVPESSSKATSESNTGQLEAADAWLRGHYASLNVPALSAAVAVRGEIAWARAIGWADIEEKRPATLDTQFRIGSTSKAVTATLTGRMIDKGIVHLDEPISRYMTGLPDKWQPLTLRQLHSHTAGIPGYENNRDWLGVLDSLLLRKRYDNVEDALSQFNNSRLLYEPGTSFYYSSFDVVLASAALQAAGNRSFLELLDAEVFRPLGINATGADHRRERSAERAVHYRRKGERFRPWRRVDLSSKLASGGLVSTPSNLVTLGTAYLQGEFLNEATVESLWAPQKLANGEINEQYYAIGWRSDRFPLDEGGPDVWQVHHGGVSKGSNAWLIVYPDHDIVVALTANARADRFSDFAGPAHELFRLFRDNDLPDN